MHYCRFCVDFRALSMTFQYQLLCLFTDTHSCWLVGIVTERGNASLPSRCPLQCPRQRYYDIFLSAAHQSIVVTLHAAHRGLLPTFLCDSIVNGSISRSTVLRWNKPTVWNGRHFEPSYQKRVKSSLGPSVKFFPTGGCSGKICSIPYNLLFEQILPRFMTNWTFHFCRFLSEIKISHPPLSSCRRIRHCWLYRRVSQWT